MIPNILLFVWMNRQNNLSEKQEHPYQQNREMRKDMILNMFVMEYVIFSRVLAHSASMSNEPLAGRRIVKVTERKTKQDWALFLEEISNEYPDAEKITLVMDNFETHKPGSLYETFPAKKAKSIWDRFEFVHTPKHGSWLNTAYFVHSTSMAEIELNVLMGQCLSRRIPEIDIIKNEVKAWQEARNNKNAKIKWQFTTDDARTKLRRLYPLSDE